LLFIREIRERLRVISLDDQQYAAALEEAALRGIIGGRTYDALCLHCARMVQTEVIYTWSVDHVRSIAPALADRIRTPG
jgi:hypothetical protein